MTRPGRSAACVALVLSIVGAPLARSVTRLPVSLRVEVRWGRNPGAEGFRADVERALATSIARTCADRVVTGAEPADGEPVDLVLVATLRDLVEEISFEDPIAIAVTPGEPTKELRRVARIEVATDARLATRLSGTELAAKSFLTSVDRRPLYAGEDAQVVARAYAVDRIVNDLTRALCRPNKKLERKIHDALAESGEGGTEAR